jgi:hypothetical protein
VVYGGAAAAAGCELTVGNCSKEEPGADHTCSRDAPTTCEDDYVSGAYVSGICVGDASGIPTCSST